VRKQLELEEQIEQLIEDVETAKRGYEEYISERIIKLFKDIREEDIPYHRSTEARSESIYRQELESSRKELASLYSKYHKSLKPSLCARIEELLKQTQKLLK
jgi:hypothetical protein